MENVMSTMEKDLPETNLADTVKVLEHLNTCKPLKASARRSTLEVNAEKFANWCLGLGGAGMGIAAAMAYWHTSYSPLPDGAKNVALALLFFSTISTLLSLLTPVLALVWVLARWKTISLKSMIDDITHESAMVDALRLHAEMALLEAKYWLELRINRAEARVAYFFGEKAAALALLGTAYICAEKFGGFPWIGKTMLAGPVSGNWGNTLLLMIIALVLGLSIGALLLKYVNVRYRFQIELIEHALRRMTQ
jgi:hypothetical protein